MGRWPTEEKMNTEAGWAWTRHTLDNDKGLNRLVCHKDLHSAATDEINPPILFTNKKQNIGHQQTHSSSVSRL